MEEINIYKNYLNDIIDFQIDKLNNLEKEISTCDSNDKDYLKGQIMSFYDSLTMIQSQADFFDINLVKLNNIDLERYLRLK